MQARLETRTSDTLSQDSQRPTILTIEMCKTPFAPQPYVVAPNPSAQFGNIDAHGEMRHTWRPRRKDRRGPDQSDANSCADRRHGIPGLKRQRRTTEAPVLALHDSVLPMRIGRAGASDIMPLVTVVIGALTRLVSRRWLLP
jgi:hypothetical protein